MIRCLNDEDLSYGWWRDPNKLKHEVEVHSNSQTEVQKAHGVPRATLSKWWHRHGFEAMAAGRRADLEGTFASTLDADDPYEELVLKALKKLGDSASVEEICDYLDIAPGKVRTALQTLEERGYRVALAEDNASVVLERVVPPTDNVYEASPELFAGELVRFGVVSDTHLCSKHCQMDELYTAYEMLHAEGIREVFHPGDLVAGKGIYRHQINDLTHHTYGSQVDYAVENYPSQPGVITRIIGGNHDLEGDFGKEGADPVKAVCYQREDFDYLGRYSAYVDLPNGGRIHLLHPMGGGSYAVSYRAQKIAEAYEGGSKPNATLFGHWHRRGDFEARGINLLLCGTFEGSSDLAVRVGLGPPAVGFHIVEAVMADDGSLVDWTARWFRFFPGRKVVRSGVKKG